MKRDLGEKGKSLSSLILEVEEKGEDLVRQTEEIKELKETIGKL